MLDNETEQMLIEELVLNFVTTGIVDMTHFNEESHVGVVANVSKKSAEGIIEKCLIRERERTRNILSSSRKKDEKINLLDRQIDRLFKIISFYEMDDSEWDEDWYLSVVKKGGGYYDD